MIDITKTYTTRSGAPVRIYSTDAGGSYPVHGAVPTFDSEQPWRVENWTAEGLYYCTESDESIFDLVEVGTYCHLKIDDKVIAFIGGYQPMKGHFAGVNPEGEPMIFVNGGTSWSSEGFSWPCDKVELAQ